MPPATNLTHRSRPRARLTYSLAALLGVVAVIFMVVGVGTAGYLLSTAVQALVRSEILAAYGERRRHREMSKLREHFIICGAGRRRPRTAPGHHRARGP